MLVVLYHFAAVFFPAILTGDIAIAHGGWDAALHRSPLWALLNGEFDVAVFFVLSGYVLTRDAFATGDPTSLRHRAAGRLLRLALPAGASTLAVFALLHAGAYRLTEAQALTGADAVFPSRLLFHFPWDGASLLDNLLWRTWFAPADVTRMYNLALWTMPVEFWGSCTVFAAGLVVVRTRLAPAFLVALALVLFRAVPRDGVALGIFVGGAALAAVPSWSGRTRRWPVRVRWSSWLGVALAAAGLAFASYNAMRPFGLPGLEPATVYGAGAATAVRLSPAGRVGPDQLPALFGAPAGDLFSRCHRVHRAGAIRLRARRRGQFRRGHGRVAAAGRGWRALDRPPLRAAGPPLRPLHPSPGAAVPAGLSVPIPSKPARRLRDGRRTQ